MDEITRKRVLETLRRWVVSHPNADQPAIQFGAGAQPSTLSPKEILREIEANTPDGQFFLEMVDHAIKHYSLEEVLNSFYSEAQAVTAHAH